MAKYHGTAEEIEGEVKRKSSDRPQSARTPRKKISNADWSTEANVKAQQPKLKKRTAPRYKDPSANSKFEMLKNIREQRVASEAKINEALQRAKLLIAEAEIAANALEIAARHSSVAQASLVEARKLIAKATQSIQSIKNNKLNSQDGLKSGYHVHAEKDEISLLNDVDQGPHRLNGTTAGFEQKDDGQNHAGKYDSPLINDANREHGVVSGSRFVPMMKQMGANAKLHRPLNDEFLKINLRNSIEQWKSRELLNQQHSQVPNSRPSYKHDHLTKLRINGKKAWPTLKEVSKKWVHGRLVEIRECE